MGQNEEIQSWSKLAEMARQLVVNYFQLELHLKSNDVEDFKCKVCDKVFSLRWRLEQRESAHAFNNVKLCHYFNNGKYVPMKK